MSSPKLQDTHHLPRTSSTADGHIPRVILYAQTHHTPSGEPISLLPLLTNDTGVTHVIVAAIHLNEGPGNITLNDDPPSANKFNQLWDEVRQLKAAGVKVMGMLGGAAKGSYWRLQGNEEQFEAYYAPLRDLIRRHSLDGLDLDVEEEISLPTITRLLSRLRSDFGPSFITTLAPVATAMIPDLRQPPILYTPTESAPLQIPHSHAHMSGFNHFALEAGHGHLVSWYHVQFYNGWGDASNAHFYDAMVSSGWPASKIVVGVLTNHRNGGSGWADVGRLSGVVTALRSRGLRFGGVMGWEYFNAGSNEGEEGRDLACSSRPWEWVKVMGTAARGAIPHVGQGVVGSAAPPGALPPTQVPWPSADVDKLCELGFGRSNAVAALNATNGDVETAAVLLLEQ
ncbi:glycoside hydrolase superfamily [Phyllosticta paracitricarpa]|uniref:chitinase n=1 Tax=Phyllosticta paracitricarpa TaxID=2016321 RepID=A0ABR1N3T4_9PEZI